MHRLHYADWSWREYGAAARCILAGKVRAGRDTGRLAAELGRRYAPSTAYPVNYGHTAIGIALALFHRRAPGRTEVVVPAYICPSVVEAVAGCGLAAVPAAIGPDLNLTPDAVRAALGPGTLAVIAPHMFGCPAQIAEIEEICRERGVFLIDDAAQVVGERCGGRQLGTFGDIGIISFAQSKAVVTGVRGSGGVLLVNNSEFDAEARAAWQALPAPDGRLGAFFLFLWNYLWTGATGQSGYYLARMGRALGRAAPAPSGPARISNLEAAIALEQLARLPRIRAAKLAAAQAYRRALAAMPAVGFPQYAEGRYLSRIMLSLAPGVDLDTLRKELDRHGVQSRLGYLQPVRAEDPDDAALAAARRMIGLPFGGNMRSGKIDKICGILATALVSAQPSLIPETKNNETSQTAH